jgi:hypothetical protein
MKTEKLLKTFKDFNLSESAMTDMELSVYPDAVKMDKNGNVSSYKTKMFIEDGKKKKPLKDAKLEKSIIAYLGDADIKTSLAVTPEAGLFSIEVYQDAKGTYIELGNKKVYFKE